MAEEKDVEMTDNSANQPLKPSPNTDEKKNDPDDFKKWKNKDVIEWITNIDSGKFNNAKYKNLISTIKSFQVDGGSIHKLCNQSVMKLMHLDQEDGKILMKNINQLIAKDADFNLCTVCAENDIDIIFIPCNHQCCCSDCYVLNRTQFTTCPICKKLVNRTKYTRMNGF